LGVRVLDEPMKTTTASELSTDETRIGPVPFPGDDASPRRQQATPRSVKSPGNRDRGKSAGSRTLKEARDPLEPADADEHAPDATDGTDSRSPDALGFDVRESEAAVVRW
jgi:hypothetical protein